MRRILLLSILFLYALNSLGQIWCYPGSEWYYTRSNITGNGYAKHTYVGDVLFQNKNCQKINYYSQQYVYLSQTLQISTSNYYTYIDNNVVYLYHSSHNVFDTLFNFNAIPGDAWYFPYHNFCGYQRWEVLDTGHQVIQGHYLKWLKIDNGSQTDYAYERIGNFNLYGFDIIADCYFDNGRGGALRCYSDNQIQNYKNYNSNCDFIQVPSGVIEYEGLNSITVFPNPSKERINIDIGQNAITKIELTNMLGRQVLEISATQLNSEIDISSLAPGIYFLNLQTENRQKVFKVVKE